MRMLSGDELKNIAEDETIKKHTYLSPGLVRLLKYVKNGETKVIKISVQFESIFIIENVNDMFVIYFKDSFLITDKNGRVLSKFGDAFNA